jgi:hypothetical protein
MAPRVVIATYQPHKCTEIIQYSVLVLVMMCVCDLRVCMYVYIYMCVCVYIPLNI